MSVCYPIAIVLVNIDYIAFIFCMSFFNLLSWHSLLTQVFQIVLRDAWSLPSERDGKLCWLLLLGSGNLRGSEHEEYEVKIKMAQKKWLELNILTWKLLFSGCDKSLVRESLLGGNFSRWGEKMRKFVASGWDVWLPTAQQWKSLCGYTNYSHTLTSFLLTYPTYCRHATWQAYALL